jgi:hypothetical protein
LIFSAVVTSGASAVRRFLIKPPFYMHYQALAIFVQAADLISASILAGGKIRRSGWRAASFGNLRRCASFLPKELS